MSFIDMMANDVWSESDIGNKVQAMIRSRYSENDELKAARLARSGEDPAFVAAVDGWIAGCVQQGREARADMALLAQVFPMEVAARRLALPEVDEGGRVTNQTAVDSDQAERAQAQAVLDGASPQARAVYAQRNPPVEAIP